MSQGNASRILELERQWLVPQGVGPSRHVPAVQPAWQRLHIFLPGATHPPACLPLPLPTPNSSALETVVDAISSFGAPLTTGPGTIPSSYSLFGTRPAGR